MSDPIKAALEAAGKRLCICDGECFETRHGMMHGLCEQPRQQTAAAVAAFLRALPVEQPNLAEAVERAAREGGDG